MTNKMTKNAFYIGLLLKPLPFPFNVICYMPDGISIEVPDFWGPMDKPEFDGRVRLMMQEHDAESALLLHVDGKGRIEVLGEWN